MPDHHVFAGPGELSFRGLLDAYTPSQRSASSLEEECGRYRKGRVE
jgi:hypothetical protein